MIAVRPARLGFGPTERGGRFFMGIFVLDPGLLLSRVAVLVGAFVRAGRGWGWTLGLVAWLRLFAWGYVRSLAHRDSRRYLRR
jgi:hypothetical protein